MSESIYTSEYQVFLAHLKSERKRSGLTQRELAARRGKSYSYVAKLETGYARMDIYQIRQYLQAVQMPFLDFMRQYDEAVRKSEQPT